MHPGATLSEVPGHLASLEFVRIEYQVKPELDIREGL